MIDGIKGSIGTIPGIPALEEKGKVESKGKGESFSDALKNAIDEVGTMQNDADKKIQGLVTGDARVSPHEAMIALQKADMKGGVMSEVNNKTALITGASSGIGYELARCFAADGCHLVLVSRSADELERIAQDFQLTYGVRVDVKHDMTEFRVHEIDVDTTVKFTKHASRSRVADRIDAEGDAAMGGFDPPLRRRPKR